MSHPTAGIVKQAAGRWTGLVPAAAAGRLNSTHMHTRPLPQLPLPDAKPVEAAATHQGRSRAEAVADHMDVVQLDALVVILWLRQQQPDAARHVFCHQQLRQGRRKCHARDVECNGAGVVPDRGFVELPEEV